VNPRPRIFLLAASVAILLSSSVALSQPDLRNDAVRKGVADIVFTNGKIYTVNGKTRLAEAVAVKDGKFMDAGSAKDIKRFVGKRTRVVDLGGAFAVPGFVDAHIHPAQPYLHDEGGALLFPETLNEKQIAEAVAAYLKRNPDAPYLFGEKWPVTLFPNRRPNKEWLDSLVSDRPAILRDETRHGAVVNTAMLKLAGITKDTPQPKYGFIEKDPTTGEPTGYLAETAQQAVFTKIPMYPDEVWERALKRAMQQLTAWGVTAYNDASTNAPQLRVYRKMDREGTLKFHVSGSIAMNDWAKDRVADSDPLVATAGEYRTSLFDTIGRKWWGDGTPLSKTSLLVGEYADGGHGTMGVDKTDLDRMVEEARKGALVRVHAMGDGTVRAILDAFERVRKLNPETVSQSHQISHCLFLRDEDIPRFRRLNVVADFSPVIYYRSPPMSVLEEAVGAENMKYVANIKKTIDGGVQVAIGSDWPTGAMDANPLRMLQVLVTRKNPYEKNADQPLGDTIGLEDAIRVMTLGGAYSMRKERELGSIEKGKSADMVVLDRNLFEIDHNSIIDTKVVYTIFAGKIVYDAKMPRGVSRP
jgi:predicted amidohydrolase YtcJ